MGPLRLAPKNLQNQALMDSTTYSSDAHGLNSRNNAYGYVMDVASLKLQKTDLY